MASPKMQKAALIMRDAHLALLDLKKVVDTVAKEIHAAELETVGQAVGHSQGMDALKALRAAAETLRSADFEAAVFEARSKVETAIAWHFTPDEV
jgi:hypothetical protein